GGTAVPGRRRAPFLTWRTSFQQTPRARGPDGFGPDRQLRRDREGGAALHDQAAYGRGQLSRNPGKDGMTPTPCEPLNERNGAVPATAPAADRVVRYTLPDQPLVTLRPSRTWAPLNLRGLWAPRELL